MSSDRLNLTDVVRLGDYEQADSRGSQDGWALRDASSPPCQVELDTGYERLGRQEVEVDVSGLNLRASTYLRWCCFVYKLGDRT